MKAAFLSFCAAIFLSFSAAGQRSVPPPVYDPLAPAYPSAINVYPGPVVSDLTIRNNLNRALFYDTTLNSLGIRLQISNGVVTLQGRADNADDVARVTWYAYNAGARLVISQLRVGP